jgi:uncharacterized protein YjaZ
MGIERTDKWLEQDFYNPENLCRKILSSEMKEAGRLYRYLLRFGMYRPSKMTMETFEELKKKETWHTAKNIYEHYQKQWKGPDVPVYIFPKSRVRNEIEPAKSGVSFKDKMFLFLHEIEDRKELEALIIHEYHHVCRLNKIQKPMDDFTLLDSMVIEGLAEFAVTKYCGKDFNAKWTSSYSKKELSYYWKKYMEDYLTIKRTHPLHDRLLYGAGRYPRLLGYALGYQLVMSQKERHTWTIQDSFTLKAEEITASL